MNSMFSVLVAVSISFSLSAQDFNTIEGDWIRVNAQYEDGAKLPHNHQARAIIRYHFTKNEVFQIVGGSTIPSQYNRTGNQLQIGPVLMFYIEEYTDKELTLLEVGPVIPVRYYLIATDSFQVSGLIKYPYQVVNVDTIYKTAPGIEPIYSKVNQNFMNAIMEGFSQKVGFNFTYVVRKDGMIGDVTIIASTNPKLNKRLISLVKKTSGNWIPGNFKNKPVNVLQSSRIGLNSN